MTETAGLRTTYGSLLYEHNVPDVDALLVTRLKEAGGIIVGKTNTPEFAAGSNTRNPVFGQTLNPWNLDLNPGGSSGGSAVALATGMCALAEGSDHGGSLRNPAAYCNVVGFRVSAGRIPAYPNPWVYDPFSVHGPMARTVRDAALMLSVMAGPDERVPISISEPGAPLAEAAEGGVKGWRVAWAPDLGGLLKVDHEVRRLTEAAALRFADLGAIVEEASPDLHDAMQIIVPLRAMRTGAIHQRELGLLDRVENAFLKQFAGRAGELGAHGRGPGRVATLGALGARARLHGAVPAAAAAEHPDGGVPEGARAGVRGQRRAARRSDGGVAGDLRDQHDRPAGPLGAVRLHGCRPADRAADRRALASRGRRPAGGSRLRGRLSASPSPRRASWSPPSANPRQP